MQLIAVLGFLAMGVVQFIAILTGLDVWFDLPGVIDVILAMILAYIPIVGSVCGIVGAVEVWDWHWVWASLLFFWPQVLFLMFAIFDTGAERAHR